MTENEKKSGIIKIVSGVVLMLAGAAGVIFGRSVKQKTIRISILVLSTLSIGSGFFLFIDGLDTIAYGQVGHTKLGVSQQEVLWAYSNQDQFKEGILTEMKRLESRRIHFSCPDRSEQFTVFNTAAGLIGVPSEDVVCANGQKLLSFDPKFAPAGS